MRSSACVPACIALVITIAACSSSPTDLVTVPARCSAVVTGTFAASGPCDDSIITASYDSASEFGFGAAFTAQPGNRGASFALAIDGFPATNTPYSSKLREIRGLVQAYQGYGSMVWGAFPDTTSGSGSYVVTFTSIGPVDANGRYELHGTLKAVLEPVTDASVGTLNATFVF